MIVMAVCHKDAHLALKLVQWIKFLSGLNGGSMEAHSFLVVASRHMEKRSILQDILWHACHTFGVVRCHVPDGEVEKGWPASCNFMFREGIKHNSMIIGNPMFWIEPDSVPITPTWYEELANEWCSSNKYFVGGASHRPKMHMTGIGFYTHDWWKMAPQLSEDQDRKPWDVYAWPQVSQSCHLTPLIQHQWGERCPGLSDIDPNAVLYHQDKTGQLIDQLDKTYYGGEFSLVFSQDSASSNGTTMRKFYHADNSNRVILSQGHQFIFDSYENFGGSWQGVFTSEDEGEIVALDALVANPSSAVTAIEQVEYEAASKKKAAIPPGSPLSVPQKSQRVAIKASPAEVVVVENPSALPNPVLPTKVESIGDILKVGEVTPSPTAIQAPTLKRRGRPPRAKPTESEEPPEAAAAVAA